MDEHTEVPPTFADRLTALIASGRADAGAPHSYREISAAIAAAGGPRMSPAYIQQLATGRRINPKIHYVQALARIFGVPVTYFLDDEPEQAPPRPEPRSDEEVTLMAMRARELSPRGRRQVMDLLELVERYERGEPDESGQAR